MSFASGLVSRTSTLLLAVLLLLPLGFASTALAGSANWQTSNIEYLYGNNFKMSDSSHATITVEHANGWKYGDNFFFLDITDPDDNDAIDFYGEFSPRLSLSSITGQSLAFPFVKDVLLAGTLELGRSKFVNTRNYLYGVGFSLDLPKFAFADLNLLVRDNPKEDGQTMQATIDWMLPFKISNVKLVFEGFGDFAGAEGTTKVNIDLQPRLLLDLGNFWGAPDDLFVGTEFIYWHNKYGVDGVEENALQAMVKWVF